MREGRTSAPVRRGRRAARALLLLVVVVASGCIVEASWTPRAVEPVVEPVTDRVTLADVACPEEGACVAVGTLGTQTAQVIEWDIETTRRTGHWQLGPMMMIA